MILAHRGASGYAPENTLEAFRLAMEMGADGFELDVHMSKDGELVVIHDETVDRTTNGTGFVKDLTLAQLKELVMGLDPAAFVIVQEAHRVLGDGFGRYSKHSL